MQILEQDILKYKRFVEHIAMKIGKSLPIAIDIRDLIQFGQIGLIDALKKFDSKRGVQFQTYAYYRIKGAIYEGIKKEANFRSYTVKYEQGCDDLIQQEDLILQDDIDKSIDYLRSLVQKFTCVYILSLDASVNISDEENVENSAISSQLSNYIKEAIAKLNDKEKKLIILYYYCGLTLKEAGTKLGISKSWASRIHAEAIKKLKDFLINSLENLNNSNKKQQKIKEDL